MSALRTRHTRHSRKVNDFVDLIAEEYKTAYEWAQDTDKLDRFCEQVAESLYFEQHGFEIDSPMKAACAKLGIRPYYKPMFDYANDRD